MKDTFPPGSSWGHEIVSEEEEKECSFSTLSLIIIFLVSCITGFFLGVMYATIVGG